MPVTEKKSDSLEDPVEEIAHLTPLQLNRVHKLGIRTIKDLLWHFPQRYESFGNFRTIRDAEPGTDVTIEGKILDIDLRKTWKRRVAVAEATVADATGSLKIIWFSQPYIAKMLFKDELVRLSGRISEKDGKRMMANPHHMKISIFSVALPETQLVAVYPETKGISSRWLAVQIAKAIERYLPISDSLPEGIRERYHLPDLSRALQAIHVPRSDREVTAARKRFSFEEIFLIQLSRQRERKLLDEQAAPVLLGADSKINAFAKSLPFSLTRGQDAVLKSIASELTGSRPMARLLEGDVGSGKTVIAAAATYAAVEANYQVAYMAPTEILARQHFEAFSTFFSKSRVKVALLTSTECRVFPSKAFPGKSAHISRTQLIKWIHAGDIRVLIGTHTLIQKGIGFDQLGLIVVDEQHRFGVRQRSKLARSKSRREERLPHFLSMTATPIPRTLALTIYGDLDLSVLDELPPGRHPIETIVATGRERESAWERMRTELKKGRQAFVICPRIEEKDDDISSVERETKRLKEIFPDFIVTGLHGKLTAREKEKRMREFVGEKIHVLVSTTVIEVGIDVPNATVMLVEDAGRFGLAQLHQLRGRIGRGEHQSVFIAISDSGGNVAKARLSALKTSSSGFSLAERDLEIRGPGELSGGRQWGLSDIGMEALKNIKMVEAAREEARALIEEDFTLEKHAELKRAVEALQEKLIHFE